MKTRVDPGYGSALAPVGSVDWAKNWRLAFQTIVKSLPTQAEQAVHYFDRGMTYRAWSLLTDGEGNHFRTFEEFCQCPQPYGLEVDYAKLKAYLEAEKGKRATELMTVSPGSQGERTDREDGTSRHCVGKSDGDERREQRLRAILRAPEVVQDLYKQGLINQTTAAKLGPKSPTPEQAAKVAEARQQIERVDRSMTAREIRKAIDQIVSQTIGLPILSPLEAAKRACSKLSEAEWLQLLEWIRGQDRAAS